MDGFRMVWDGKSFISRQGKVFTAPEWFKAGMPKKPLDGELFLGRGMFNGIQAAMACGWRGLRYMVFDCPLVQGGFSERLEDLKSLSFPAHCQLVPQEPVEGIEAMMAFAGDVVASGGEGAVVRAPRAVYTAGRTSDVLRWVPQDPALNRKTKTRLALV